MPFFAPSTPPPPPPSNLPPNPPPLRRFRRTRDEEVNPGNVRRRLFFNDTPQEDEQLQDAALVFALGAMNVRD